VTDFAQLPATRKLYQDDPYRIHGVGTVLAIEEDQVVLDQSVFYAESGGQASDTGTLGGHPVVSVAKQGGTPYQLPNGETARIGTVTVHRLAEPADLEVGQEVPMEIDWQRRYHNMQMHTLAHFLFHAAGEYFERSGQERRTRGAYIEGDSARFDFVGTVAPDDVQGIEERVRGLLADAGEATTEELADDVRVWRSGEIAIPCGGTHIGDVREIVGEVGVRRRSKGAGLTRLYVTLERSPVPG